VWLALNSRAAWLSVLIVAGRREPSGCAAVGETERNSISSNFGGTCRRCRAPRGPVAQTKGMGKEDPMRSDHLIKRLFGSESVRIEQLYPTFQIFAS
jgi:hypothetical protein